MSIFTDLPDNEWDGEGMVSIEPTTRKFVTGEAPLASTFNYYFRKLVKTVLQLNSAVITVLTAQLKDSEDKLLTPKIISQVFDEMYPIGTVVTSGVHLGEGLAGYKIINGIWYDTTGNPVSSPIPLMDFKPKYGIWMPMLEYVLTKTTYEYFWTNCEYCRADRTDTTVTMRELRDGNLVYFCRIK